MSAKVHKGKSVRLGDVLKAGRKFGLQNPNVLALYQQWLQEAQSQAEESERPIACIKLEITCAEMYMELDLMEEAAECFHDALYEAQQEGLRDAVQDLERALEAIESPPSSRYTL